MNIRYESKIQHAFRRDSVFRQCFVVEKRKIHKILVVFTVVSSIGEGCNFYDLLFYKCFLANDLYDI
jgi:hypothetical protein